jgi:CheY-like chemotaxis protein
MTEVSRSTENRPKMLIADDDPLSVRMLAYRCSRAGFDVDAATNGVQALIKATRSHPDVLVIDVNMPEPDGLTVCARLADTLQRPLDVVVITGSRNAEIVKRCESFGARYVRKGPGFWNGLGAALTQLIPHLAGRIDQLRQQPVGSEMRERPRLLIIDDDPAVGQLFSARLDKCGVQLLCVPDVVQGFRMACSEAPSVIVSDYFLPNGGFHYLLNRLRARTETRTIPVVVLTGRDVGEKVEQSLLSEVCGNRGVARIFRKSRDADAMFVALQELCGFDYVVRHPA